MHYSILVTVEVKREDENHDDNAVVKSLIDLITRKMAESDNHEIMAGIQRDRLFARQSTFSRNVADAIEVKLEPYWEQTDDSKYLEFIKDEGVEEEYENGTIDCIKSPDGRISPNYLMTHDFVIKDGKVYQRHAGQLHHEKRTKKAKKYTAVLNYPFKKLYTYLYDFAAEYHGYVYDEYEQGYGYYVNPNAFYDWYVIGGRWPRAFLVKDTCKEFSYGERYRINEDGGAPNGYRWVSAARKKDIDWDMMMKLAKTQAEQTYALMAQAFLEKKLPEGYHGIIKEDGIYDFDYVYYLKDETLEQYMHRKCLDGRHIYPPMFYGMLKTEGYYSKDDMYCHPKTKKVDVDNAMCRKMDDFIAGLDDETVLVAVDIHI